MAAKEFTFLLLLPSFGKPSGFLLQQNKSRSERSGTSLHLPRSMGALRKPSTYGRKNRRKQGAFSLFLPIGAQLPCRRRRRFTRRQLVKFFNAASVDELNHDASLISGDIMADGDPAVGPRMRCSNGLWLDQSLTLKPSFKQILDSDYRAALNPVDFQTKPPDGRQQINSWVENETSGLVKDLIREGSLNNSVRLVFANALYFKGAWRGQSLPCFLSISKEESEKENLDPVTTAMMKKEFGRWYQGYKMVNHPFKKPREDERDFLMYFCFPWIESESEDGRRSHITETLMDACGHNMTPKLNINSEMEVSDALRGLGVTLPFSGGKLTEMLSSFNGRKLYALSIFQKSVVEMNEQWTETASATFAIVMSGAPPCLPPVPTLGFGPEYPFYIYGGILAAQTESAFMALPSPLPL